MELKEIIEKRESVRSYEDRPVPEEKLEKKEERNYEERGSVLDELIHI